MYKKYFTLIIIVICVFISEINAQNKILNNDRIRVGNGSENSINTYGNMQQPWYYNGDHLTWYKLTYSNYPLDIRLGVGGDGTNSWNINGVMVSNPTWSNQVYDYSNFTITNPTTGDGYGTIKTTGNITIDSKLFLVENTYTLPEPDGYIQINVKLTNQSGSSVDNVRLWVGTRDDWVGTSDGPTKTRGNLVDGSFSPISSVGDQAKAIKVSTGTEAIMFYSNSSRAYTTINSCCSFTNATNQNPATNVITATGDGSYAIYVRFNDLANNESDELEWFYAAGTLAEIDDIIDAVASASGSVDNITQTTADFTYETSESGTTYYVVVTAGSTIPTEAQIEAGVNYTGGTIITSGNASTTANTEHVFNLTGLSANTSYTVYAVTEYNNGDSDVYSSIANASFTTLASEPTVTTTAITSITSTSVSSGGNVTSDGGDAVTARGVCWSTSNSPTTADSKTTDGAGTGSFTSSITGLTAGTTYYVRAYATNSVGTEYGGEESFSTAKPEMDLKQSTTAIADGGSHDFGGVIINQSTDVVFTIENTGTSNLTLTTPLTIGGTDAGQFSVQTQPTSPIAASGSTTFTVRFSPTSTGAKTASISISNDDDDENPYELNLTGTCLEYPFITISGHVKYGNGDPVDNVAVTFSNSGLTATTNADGYYVQFITKGWSGSTTVALDDHTFNPQGYSYSNVQTNNTNQDFLASRDHVIISGFIRDENNNGIEDFEISFNNGGATVTTSEGGYYSTSVTYGWSGTATATKAGWTCTPDQKTYVNVCEDCPDQNYLGQLMALGAEDDFSTIPAEFTILPAYPNPFNPSTTITYGLNENSDVTIAIYDLSGKLITTLLNKEQPQGWHTIEWNGTDMHNNQVPAGIYLSRITSNNTTNTSKLMLLK